MISGYGRSCVVVPAICMADADKKNCVRSDQQCAEISIRLGGSYLTLTIFSGWPESSSRSNESKLIPAAATHGHFVSLRCSILRLV